MTLKDIQQCQIIYFSRLNEWNHLNSKAGHDEMINSKVSSEIVSYIQTTVLTTNIVFQRRPNPESWPDHAAARVKGHTHTRDYTKQWVKIGSAPKCCRAQGARRKHST